MVDIKGEEKAYLKALKHLSDDEGYPIGSYVGALRRRNRRYRKAIQKAIESCCYDAAIADLRKFMEGEE